MAAYVYSPGYSMDWQGHVFPVQKYRLVHERLRESGLLNAGNVFEPSPASQEELELVHTPDYLKLLDELCTSPERGYALFEVPCTREVVDGFRLAAGGTLLACRKALDWGAAANIGGGFHHACADHGEGFCLINDIAVALRSLLGEGTVRRALVVDLDVHQGNGTASIFRKTPEVFTFSMHQERLYPSPKEAGSLDIGLDDGVGDENYLSALREALPKAFAHAPDLAVYLAGADPFESDLLGGLKLTKAGLKERDEMVIGACRHYKIPVAVTLGGGYAHVTEDVVDIHAATLASLERAFPGNASRRQPCT